MQGALEGLLLLCAVLAVFLVALQSLDAAQALTLAIAWPPVRALLQFGVPPASALLGAMGAAAGAVMAAAAATRSFGRRESLR